jgi:hypothetical protein
MPAFHQIGHDSENLLWEPGLQKFAGAILSPLNYTAAETVEQISKLRKAGKSVLFDPHLYRPQSDRLQLPTWDYYPKDVETADLSSEAWWTKLIASVAKTAVEIGVDAVLSPAIVPKMFSDEFFLDLVSHANQLEKHLQGTKVQPFQTVVVNLGSLAAATRVMAIASILSGSHVQNCAIAFLGDVEPRKELADPEELKGAMRLISALTEAGQEVTVAFCSSDMLLWKAAGAANCASGKFFNLRRFTLSRFEEPSGGGGQLPYWFEESLLAFLRQSDLLRVQAKDLLSNASEANPFSSQIMAAIPASKAWVALGWRHFLHWFADAEHRLNSGISADELVNAADANWETIESSKPPVFMEERHNNGSWVRQWRRALAEFPYF